MYFVKKYGFVQTFVWWAMQTLERRVGRNLFESSWNDWKYIFFVFSKLRTRTWIGFAKIHWRRSVLLCARSSLDVQVSICQRNKCRKFLKPLQKTRNINEKSAATGWMVFAKRTLVNFYTCTMLQEWVNVRLMSIAVKKIVHWSILRKNWCA